MQSAALRTTSAGIPLRRSTLAVPEVAISVKPSSVSLLHGIVRDRLSRSATETNTVPEVGRPPNAAACDFPNASGKRSEEHTSELQSRGHLVCRLLLEKQKEIQ